MYQHPWPDDLPEKCNICGTKFRTNFNIVHGPGKLGRIFRNAAHYGVLPSIFIGLVLPAMIPIGGMNRNEFSGMLFLALLLCPVLKVLSLFMPLSRRLVCKKCGWKRDYEAIPSPKPDPAAN